MRTYKVSRQVSQSVSQSLEPLVDRIEAAVERVGSLLERQPDYLAGHIRELTRAVCPHTYKNREALDYNRSPLRGWSTSQPDYMGTVCAACGLVTTVDARLEIIWDDKGKRAGLREVPLNVEGGSK